MSDKWQTGKPEEEGQYLVYCDDGIGADVDDFLYGEWHFYKDHVKAWKKIYVPLWLLKEKEDGHTYQEPRGTMDLPELSVQV